ncbi:MAG: alpha/beta fold hydrolase [Anaerolineae bacterium]
MKKAKAFVSGVVSGGATGVLALYIYWRYQREMRAAREQALVGSRVVETACGPIEYAAGGVGPPVLVVHGAGGGYDQGLAIARLASTGFRWIVPSRFGYLRTPMPDDASPEAQADAFAALLDALDIPRAAVVAVSAGGPSALQFALRHPDRCTALVMVSAVSVAALPGTPWMRPAYELAFRWDFIFWLMVKFARPALLALLGVNPAVQARLSPAERDWLAEFLQTALPVSLRRDGLLHDLTLCPDLPRYPLERITAPTLVIHAADDSVIPISDSEFMVQAIPDAQLVALRDGDHLLLGWQEELGARVAEFLKQHAD